MDSLAHAPTLGMTGLGDSGYLTLCHLRPLYQRFATKSQDSGGVSLLTPGSQPSHGHPKFSETRALKLCYPPMEIAQEEFGATLCFYFYISLFMELKITWVHFCFLFVEE